MDEFPVEYDAIVLGTGFPESVVAAAVSRVGNKVLHLDRNDYYSGQWVTLTFDALQKWINENQTRGSEGIVEVETQEDEVPSLEPGTYSIPVPSSSHEISNVVVKSYFCEKEQEVCNDAELSTASLDAKETDTAEGISNLKEDLGSEKSEFLGTPKETRTANLKAPELAEDSTSKKDQKTSTENQGDEKGSVAEKSKCSDAENLGEKFLKEEQGTEETSNDKGHEGKLMSNGTNYQGQTQATVQTEEKERKTSISINMTVEDLKPFWRQFNIDLSPKLLFSRGKLVETLISANISHYAEFKAVSRILTYLQDKVEEVPCSRADVFSSNVISVVEKRMLMKFLTFCLDFEDNRDQYEEYKGKTFAEYLHSRRLTPNLQHFIMHAIAMVKQDTSTETGLKATQSFLQSLGRYGNTPFIWALYGAGELPQAYCRMCAVFGGLYCLRRGASGIVVDEATKQCVGIISDNQFLKCKWLIMEYSYVPEEMRKDCRQSVSRGVFITSGSLKVCEEEHITLLSVPPLSDGREPVRVIELGGTALACPKGVYVVHLICRGSSSAKEDLEPTASRLFHFPTQGEKSRLVAKGDLHDEKPTVLWSLYFNQSDPNSSSISGIPSNVFVTSLPGVSLGFNDALQQAKGIFEEICPNEEFLPAVPNPEDIILDDFLQDATQSASEQPLEGDGSVTRIPASLEEAASSDAAAAEHPGGSGRNLYDTDENIALDHESPPNSP